MDPQTTSETFESDPEWLKILTEGHRPMLFLRSVMKHLPADPRCKVCSSPFAGVGGKVTGIFGFRPSRKNPYLCGQCIDSIDPGGALIDIGVLFVDMRDSTGLGERLGAGQFVGVVNRFYHLATKALLDHDGLIDKLIGDEVMALFIPGVSGPDYRRKTCEAGLSLIRSVNDDSATQGLSFGVSVHAGPAFVGNVGGSGIVDFTAIGDTVNTAARLQALAQPGELVVSEELCRSVAGAASLEGERRTVELKGKSEPVAVRVIRP